MKAINRKDFLKLMGTGVALGVLGKLSPLESATLAANGRTLINILLEGGPDFRHLFVPPPSSSTTSYGYKYWNNRTTSIGRGASSNDPTGWQTIYENAYEEMSLTDNSGNTITFGVLKDNNGTDNANAWLREKIKSGNVAIINNVYHSISRDHSHSLLILQSGSYQTGIGQAGIQGWGGALASAISGKVISFTNQLRPFSNVSDKSKLLSFTNSRSFGLRQPTFTNDRVSVSDAGLRALNSYYQALNTAGTVSSKVYDKFVQQQIKIQNLSTQIQSQLALPSGTSSSDLETIYPGLGSSFYTTDTNGQTGFKSRNFRSQILNLYDAFQVSSLLEMRVASLNYGGWDSHKNQLTDIEPQFNDIFGTERGLYALFNGQSSLFDDCVVTIGGEFGRQLKSNGDLGTDHGRGNTYLVIGGGVKGGIYGEMFPTRESTDDASGQSLYDRFNRDIQGRTAFHKIFGKVCDWVGSTVVTGENLGTTGNTVFDTSTNPLPTITDDSGNQISSNGWESDTSYDFFN
ncbi:MAG: DUF1501 domain-containing protein [Spirochaetota bacterium]